MDEKVTLDQIAGALAKSLTICAPDEYQMRQNHLTRLVASYLLNDSYGEMEGNDE